jgi:hypothetical protein
MLFIGAFSCVPVWTECHEDKESLEEARSAGGILAWAAAKRSSLFADGMLQSQVPEYLTLLVKSVDSQG